MREVGRRKTAAAAEVLAAATETGEGEASNDVKAGWILENENWYYYENGAKKAEKWLYEEEANAWYYFDRKGAMYRGRLKTGAGTYFFGEDGRMLTGWVYCPEGDMPEVFTGSAMEDDVYYCGADRENDGGLG